MVIDIDQPRDPADRQPLQPRDDVGDRVLPADLAVGDQVEARSLLLLDGGQGHLPGRILDLRGGSLTTVDTGDGDPELLLAGSVAELRVVANSSGYHKTGKSIASPRSTLLWCLEP